MIRINSRPKGWVVYDLIKQTRPLLRMKGDTIKITWDTGKKMGQLGKLGQKVILSLNY
jgi:hypothetical protein